MNIKDFKVGQTVYVELTGNASRGKAPEQCIEEWEITSVGRKYIRARKKENGIFRFETTFEYRESYKRLVEKTDCRVDYILYLTRQEIEEKHEKSRLFREITDLIFEVVTEVRVKSQEYLNSVEAWWIRKFIDEYGKENVFNISVPKITIEDLQREYAKIVGGQMKLQSETESEVV